MEENNHPNPSETKHSSVSDEDTDSAKVKEEICGNTSISDEFSDPENKIHALFPENEKEAIDRNLKMWHLPPLNHQEANMTQNSYDARLISMSKKHHGPVITVGESIGIDVSELTNFLKKRTEVEKRSLSTIVKKQQLGFPGYRNVQGQYNEERQKFSTCNIQTSEHFRWIKTNLPGYFQLHQAVERLHPDLDILAAHFLYQNFEVDSAMKGPGTTDFGWHWDVGNAASSSENPKGLKIIRSIVVKLTPGESRMQMGGYPETVYPINPGSYTDFRSECYHRSVIIKGTVHYKIAFFLGYRD